MIPAGSEAFVIINKKSGSRSSSGDRARLEGAARVEILDYHDGIYHTKVLAGTDLTKGSIRVFPRKELFFTKEERQYFGELVSFLWGGKPITMERPATLEEDRGP